MSIPSHNAGYFFHFRFQSLRSPSWTCKYPFNQWKWQENGGPRDSNDCQRGRGVAKRAVCMKKWSALWLGQLRSSTRRYLWEVTVKCALRILYNEFVKKYPLTFSSIFVGLICPFYYNEHIRVGSLQCRISAWGTIFLQMQNFYVNPNFMKWYSLCA